MNKKILVIGNGAREHAIINKLKESPLVDKIFAINGNAGIDKIATSITHISIKDHELIVLFCHKEKIDLVVIGPEEPLVNGLSNKLSKAKIRVFGPTKEASMLEASKVFTKKICKKYKIPTGHYEYFENESSAIKGLKLFKPPYVIKLDGIAAGKGVVIAKTEKEAVFEIKAIFSGKFGDIAKKVLIEEYLEGKEISLFAISDGNEGFFFETACDYKKVGDGNIGLNTGGMGAYSPSHLVSKEDNKNFLKIFINPVIKEMKNRNTPFVGFLFAGLVLTKDGPKLLEFNTRLGDPEAEVILPRLKSDLFLLMVKAIEKKLDHKMISFSDNFALSVVICSNGYPVSYEKNIPIPNISTIERNLDDKNIIIFHAGTKQYKNQICAIGGRVLTITAIGNNLSHIRDKIYRIIEQINWKDGFFRTDIGLCENTQIVHESQNL